MCRLFLVALVAVAFGISSGLAASPKADEVETDAIARIVKLGGTAKIDDKLDETARVAVKLPTANDAALQKLCKLPSIGAVEILDATKCTEVGFAKLKELPDLQTLVLGKCPLTEKEATAIGTLRTLTVLFIGESKLTDVALAHFDKLVNLKILDVSGAAAITDKSAPVFVGLKKLEELNLSGTKFGDDGVTALKELEQLRILRLNQSNVTRKGIDAIEAARGKDLTVKW